MSGASWSAQDIVPSDFISYFSKYSWNGKVILLIDEFSSLYQANDDVRNDCLETFRGLKQNRENRCPVHYCCWDFNIVYLDPTNSGVPPFNVADVI